MATDTNASLSTAAEYGYGATDVSLFAALIFLVYTPALVLNPLVLYITVRPGLIDLPFKWFIGMLSTMDLTLAIVTAFGGPIVVLDQTWIPTKLCGLSTYLSSVSISCMGMSTTLIALNRYIGICCSQDLFDRLYGTTKKVLIQCVLTVCFYALIYIPELIEPMPQPAYPTVCPGAVVAQDLQSYTVMVMNFAAPLAIVLLMTSTFLVSRIYASLRKHHRETAAALAGDVDNSSLQIANAITAQLIIAITSSLPLNVIVAASPRGQMPPGGFWTFHVPVLIFAFNTWLDPISTFVVVKPYRKALRRMLLRGRQGRRGTTTTAVAELPNN